MSFKVKTNAIDISNIMKTFPVKTYPDLGRFIVNKLAFEARKQAVKRIKKQFIIRRRFTIGKILFQQAPKTRKLEEVRSSYGATVKADYMKEQEEGFVLKPTKGTYLPIPTRLARRSQSIAKVKSTSKSFGAGGIGTLRKTNEMRGKTKKQRTIALIQDMIRKKQQSNRLALLPFPNKPGIYKISRAGKAKPGAKTRFKFRLRQIYDTSKRQLRIKPSPWMAPVNKGIQKNYGRIAEAAFNKFIMVLKQ